LNNSETDNLYDLNDEVLMLSYQAGTVAAFDVLYARHKGGLYRYVLRQLNNQPELSNEIFQDVWMKLINARMNYQPSAKFSTWLYRIAHNRLVDYWRSEKHEGLQVAIVEAPDETDNVIQSSAEIDSPSCDEPLNTLQQKQTQQQIKQAIAQLPEEQRSAILLKEDAGLSLAQIAEVTGVNRETVKSRLRYGIKRLQGMLHPLRPVS